MGSPLCVFLGSGPTLQCPQTCFGAGRFWSFKAPVLRLSEIKLLRLTLLEDLWTIQPANHKHIPAIEAADLAAKESMTVDWASHLPDFKTGTECPISKP